MSEPYTPYENYAVDKKHIGVWRTYQINELAQRSEFNGMERCKIGWGILKNAIKINKMLFAGGKNGHSSADKTGRLRDYFCLHDRWLLHGESKYELFSKILDERDKIDDRVGKIGVMYEQLKDGTDDPSDIVNGCLKHKILGEWADFGKKKLLGKKFNLRAVWIYFGDRIS